MRAVDKGESDEYQWEGKGPFKVPTRQTLACHSVFGGRSLILRYYVFSSRKKELAAYARQLNLFVSGNFHYKPDSNVTFPQFPFDVASGQILRIASVITATT